MYMVSLQQFLELFDFSIDNSDKAPLASKRIVNIIDYLTFYVTCYMQRGLFERHKLIWVLMLAMKIESVADRLSAAYIGCLLKGGGALDAKSEKAKPPSGCPRACGSTASPSRRTVQMLRDLPDSIARGTKDAWREWYDHDAPETARCPSTRSGSTSSRSCSSCARCARTARCSPCRTTSSPRSAAVTWTRGRSTCARSTDEASCRMPDHRAALAGRRPDGHHRRARARSARRRC